MSKRDGVAAALAFSVAMTAASQPAPAPADGAATGATAAMERARRQAAGPMRVILEASKSRRRGGEGDAVAPADAAPVRAPAARVAPAVPLAPLAGALAPPAAPEANPAIATQITFNADALQSKTAAAAAPALEATGTAAALVSLPGLTPDLDEVQTGPARPRVASRVEPEVGQRVLDELGRNAVVVVDLTIRADGRVAAVAPVGAMPLLLQRALMDALGQWRFDPLPQERVHRIELIFNSEN